MDDLWICPNCGSAMKQFANSSGLFHICNKCGCTIEGKEQKYEAEYCCPNCHQQMGSGCECQHCGYDLGSDFD
jgi:hypothetical protein